MTISNHPIMNSSLRLLVIRVAILLSMVLTVEARRGGSFGGSSSGGRGSSSSGGLPYIHGGSSSSRREDGNDLELKYLWLPLCFLALIVGSRLVAMCCSPDWGRLECKSWEEACARAEKEVLEDQQQGKSSSNRPVIDFKSCFFEASSTY